MSKQLSVSAAFSIFAMAAFALFAAHMGSGEPGGHLATPTGSTFSASAEIGQDLHLPLLNR